MQRFREKSGAAHRVFAGKTREEDRRLDDLRRTGPLVHSNDDGHAQGAAMIEFLDEKGGRAPISGSSKSA